MDLLPSGSLTKTVYTFHIISMRATYPAHLIFPDSIIVAEDTQYAHLIYIKQK
jgi:hypothetical protein